MPCEKCNYKDKKEIEKFGIKLCPVCNYFAPEDRDKFNNYISEKIDWKVLETFRKFGETSAKQKSGMQKKAEKGIPVTRAPLGYTVIKEKLIPNEFASKVHSIFKIFLEKNYSLNSMSKNYGLSVNGLKKILKNRTYLGEIKFSGRLSKGKHKAIISPEIFYAVQRKLGEVRKVR